MNIGYYNGEIAPLEELKVPLNDRAMYFGDGVYDATMCKNGKVLEIERHIERFFNSMRLLQITPAWTKDELKQELYRVLEAADTDKWILLYWSATRGTAPRGHAFPTEGKANLIITATEKPGMRNPYKHMNVITFEDKRFEYCNIKTLNLIPSCLASEAAEKAGCDEAVFYRGDEITECSRSNIFILKDGILKTAPADCYILPGISRAGLIDRAKEVGIPVEEKRFTKQEMMEADEVIITSSGTIGSPVMLIDGVKVGGKDPKNLEILRKAAISYTEAYMGVKIYNEM